MVALLSVGKRFLLVLFLSWFTPGCASIPGTGASSVAFQSYDVPGKLDSNAVIRAVERSFIHTLGTLPRVIEGSVPSSLPDTPANFAVEDRRVRLDRLGVVSIPHVVCPLSMATMHGFIANTPEAPGLHSYTGCIQLYAGGYRIHIVDSMIVPGSQTALTPSQETEVNFGEELVARIAQALVEQISEARLVLVSRTQGSARPLIQTPGTVSMNSAPSLGEVQEVQTVSPPGGDQEQGGSPSFPLVCLAPKHESATVRSQPGAGRVVRMLQPGSVVAVAEAVDATYFRVEPEEGTTGWVNRSDVKRLPCPIG